MFDLIATISRSEDSILGSLLCSSNARARRSAQFPTLTGACRMRIVLLSAVIARILPGVASHRVPSDGGRSQHASRFVTAKGDDRDARE